MHIKLEIVHTVSWYIHIEYCGTVLYNCYNFIVIAQDFTSVIDSLLDERNDISFSEKGREVCFNVAI